MQRFLVEANGERVGTWKNAYKWHFISPSAVLVGVGEAK